jgi:glycosyltransferase involved in cell wall biosynthesis
VIRAYNEARHIARLLEGIRQQTVTDVQIILVDSGSTDDTLDIVKRYPVQVQHIDPGEFTFGRSLNRGLALAEHDLVVIASAHVYPVYPDWLERLLKPFEDSQIGLSYGKQRGNSSSKFSERQIFSRWFPDSSTPRQAHPFCNNANAAVRRALWQQHPYDETLSGLEDLAWANWAIQQGRYLSYVAEAEIIHVHDETPRAVYNRYRREAIAFKRIFPNEHFGLRHFFKLVFTNISSDIWQAARGGDKNASNPANTLASIVWYRLMQFWGTYLGYRHSGPLSWQLRQTFYYPQVVPPGQTPGARGIEPIQYGDNG